MSSPFDTKTLTQDFYTLVPNTFLVFSLAILFTIILNSNNSFQAKPYGMFCFTKQPKIDDCGDVIPSIKKTDSDTLDCPEMTKLDKNDVGKIALIAYIMRTSYEVTHNATNSVIHLLLRQIQQLNIIKLYLLFYIMLKLSKETVNAMFPLDLVKAIFPFDLFKTIRTANTSILIDFMEILLSVITLLFTICFLVANVVYFSFLFVRLAQAKGHYVKLIPILAIMLLIIIFILIVVGINSQGKKKNGKMNLLFIMLIAFAVPFVATFHTLGYALLSGFINIFTGGYTRPDVHDHKDKYNKYKIEKPEEPKITRGGATTDAASVAVAAGVTAVSVAAAVSGINLNTSKNKNNNDNAPNNMQNVKDDPNAGFNTKLKKIRTDALWFIGGLVVLTSTLAMLNSSTQIMKEPKATELIRKIRMVLI